MMATTGLNSSTYSKSRATCLWLRRLMPQVRSKLEPTLELYRLISTRLVSPVPPKISITSTWPLAALDLARARNVSTLSQAMTLASNGTFSAALLPNNQCLDESHRARRSESPAVLELAPPTERYPSSAPDGV